MKFVEPSPVTEKNIVYAQYLASYYDTPMYLEWYSCFENEFFLFLSLMAGRIDPIPEIDELNKMREEAFIYYDYVNKPIDELTEYYDKSKSKIETINERVDRRIDLESLELDTDFYQKSFSEFLNKV